MGLHFSLPAFRVIYIYEFPDNWGRLMHADRDEMIYPPWYYHPRDEDHPWFEHHDESWTVPNYEYRNGDRIRWFNLTTLAPGSRFERIFQ